MSDPGLRLTVLGCDGSWPGPGGAGSGYLVRSATTSLVVDAGPGTFAQLQLHLDPAGLDAAVVTHHHPDHWSDLWSLAAQALYGGGRPGLDLYAPTAVGERSGLDRSYAVTWHPVTDGDEVRVGDLSLRFHRTDHEFETLAVRVDGAGRSLGYSADTGPGWSLSALGPGLDLVLCEATYTADHEGELDHLSGRQAGDQARAAGARRLVVTHRWATIDPGTLVAEAEAAFGGPVEQAAMGKEFSL